MILYDRRMCSLGQVAAVWCVTIDNGSSFCPNYAIVAPLLASTLHTSASLGWVWCYSAWSAQSWSVMRYKCCTAYKGCNMCNFLCPVIWNTLDVVLLIFKMPFMHCRLAFDNMDGSHRHAAWPPVWTWQECAGLSECVTGITQAASFSMCAHSRLPSCAMEYFAAFSRMI